MRKPDIQQKNGNRAVSVKIKCIPMFLRLLSSSTTSKRNDRPYSNYTKEILVVSSHLVLYKSHFIRIHQYKRHRSTSTKTKKRTYSSRYFAGKCFVE